MIVNGTKDPVGAALGRAPAATPPAALVVSLLSVLSACGEYGLTSTRKRELTSRGDHWDGKTATSFHSISGWRLYSSLRGLAHPLGCVLRCAYLARFQTV
jgi:hypothetical protein